MIHPLRLYADGLRRARAGGWPGSGASLRLRDGTTLPLPLDRYLGPADATDRQLLRDLHGPVLDVGCGPGRHLHALAARGVFALGVDLSPAAVELATGRGARAVVASIFDELPGSGRWRSALLLDGNIGIGGAPARLLARIGMLLREDGELLLGARLAGRADRLDARADRDRPRRQQLVSLGARVGQRPRSGRAVRRLLRPGALIAQRTLVRASR